MELEVMHWVASIILGEFDGSKIPQLIKPRGFGGTYQVYSWGVAKSPRDDSEFDGNKEIAMSTERNIKSRSNFIDEDGTFVVSETSFINENGVMVVEQEIDPGRSVDLDCDFDETDFE